MNDRMNTQVATFAAGCFWGVEEEFRRTPGVLEVTSGYSGGNTAEPTYEQVCTGRTGHAESVDVRFDPQRVTYADLVERFWTIHDPTTPNRQGPDVGTQYRSAIFTHSDEQARVARESLARAQTRFNRPISTQIVAATAFFPAEDYHQRYFERRGIRSH
jgi:peptide-methionine (S)-S-oxide reductase